MRVSLMLMIRLIALGALGSSVVAIGVSRSNPRPRDTHATGAPRYYGVHGGLFSPSSNRDFLLDAESGRIREANLGSAVIFKYAVSVPWRDELGRHFLLGRLSTLTGTGTQKVMSGSGLAVLGVDGSFCREFPEPETAVSGFPCWLPGHSDRVLFPGGDCRIYVQEFGSFKQLVESSDGAERRARPIEWRCEAPGDGVIFMSEPASIPCPSHGDYIAVSLASTRDNGGKKRFDAARLWWLKLDPIDQSILAAGPLTPHSAAEERFASFSASPDGTLNIAYLSRPPGAQTWNLKLAPVSFDVRGEGPSVRADQVREVACDVAAMLPMFSSDGRWLCRNRNGLPAPGTVPRIDVARALAESTTDATP